MRALAETGLFSERQATQILQGASLPRFACSTVREIQNVAGEKDPIFYNIELQATRHQARADAKKVFFPATTEKN